ncbi:MAG: HK97 gp10 family phage protein [Evtepia sp.]
MGRLPGGTLRDGWTILPIQKQGDAYTITVINNLEYASYVEFAPPAAAGAVRPSPGQAPAGEPGAGPVHVDHLRAGASGTGPTAAARPAV